jgi:hypothetical protein
MLAEAEARKSELRAAIAALTASPQAHSECKTCEGRGVVTRYFGSEPYTADCTDCQQGQSEDANERRCHCCGEPFDRCRRTYIGTTAEDDDPAKYWREDAHYWRERAATLRAALADIVDFPTDFFDRDENDCVPITLLGRHLIAARDALDITASPQAAPEGWNPYEMLALARRMLVAHAGDNLDAGERLALGRIDECIGQAASPQVQGVEAVTTKLREIFDERVEELAQRLVASGPKAAHVSASECHEITDAILDARAALASGPSGVDGGAT